MAYDWKKLEREDRERSDRSGVILMVTWLSIGAVGAVVHLLTGFGGLDTSLIYIAMGLMSLVIWRLVIRGRRRERQSQKPLEH